MNFSKIFSLDFAPRQGGTNSTHHPRQRRTHWLLWLLLIFLPSGVFAQKTGREITPKTTLEKPSLPSNSQRADQSQALYDNMVALFRLQEQDFSDYDKNLQQAENSEDIGFLYQVFAASLKRQRYADSLNLIQKLRSLNPKSDPEASLLFAVQLLNDQPDTALSTFREQYQQRQDESVVGSQTALASLLGHYLEKISLVWDQPATLIFLEKLTQDGLLSSPLLRQQVEDMRIELLVLQNQLQPALQSLNKQLLLDPKNLSARQKKAELFKSIDDLEQATAVWDSARRDYPFDTQIRHQAALFYYSIGEFAQASELLAIHKKTLSEDEKRLLMLSYAQQNQVENMLAVYDFSKLSDAGRNARYLELAKALFYAQHPPFNPSAQGLAVLGLLNKINIDEVGGDLNYDVNTLRVALAYQQSIAAGEGAFKAYLLPLLEAEKPQDHSTIGQLETQTNPVPLIDFEWQERLLIERFALANSVKQYQLAYDITSEILSLRPKDVDWLYTRAMIADKLDRNDLALADLEKVLLQNPDSTASNAVGYTMLLVEGYSPRAEQLIRSAFIDDPLSEAVIDSVGWLHYLKGNTAEAVRYLHAAYYFQREPEIAQHYISALVKAGDLEAAKHIYRAQETAMREVNRLPSDDILAKLQ